MFEKLRGAFEKYSQSSNNYKDVTLRNISVKMGPSMVAKDIINILKDLKYKTISYNETYHEIFTSKAGYEVTVTLVATSGGSTTIICSVYNETQRGKTRKALRYLLHTFKERFNPYIVNE